MARPLKPRRPLRAGTRLRVKAHVGGGLAGLEATLVEDLATHLWVLIPDAPDNPVATHAPKDPWWRTHLQHYALRREELEVVSPRKKTP